METHPPPVTSWREGWASLNKDAVRRGGRERTEGPLVLGICRHPLKENCLVWTDLRGENGKVLEVKPFQAGTSVMVSPFVSFSDWWDHWLLYPNPSRTPLPAELMQNWTETQNSRSHVLSNKQNKMKKIDSTWWYFWKVTVDDSKILKKPLSPGWSASLIFFNLGLSRYRVQRGYGASPGEKQIPWSEKYFPQAKTFVIIIY